MGSGVRCNESEGSVKVCSNGLRRILLNGCVFRVGADSGPLRWTHGAVWMSGATCLLARPETGYGGSHTWPLPWLPVASFRSISRRHHQPGSTPRTLASPEKRVKPSRTSPATYVGNGSDFILTISPRAGNASFVEEYTTLERQCVWNFQIGSKSGYRSRPVAHTVAAGEEACEPSVGASSICGRITNHPNLRGLKHQ